MINRSSRFTVSAEIVARQVGEETVLLDLQSGTYLGIDPIGTRIWNLIGEGKSVSEVCAVIVEEYEAPREIVERDAQDFLSDLADKKLIAVV